MFALRALFRSLLLRRRLLPIFSVFPGLGGRRGSFLVQRELNIIDVVPLLSFGVFRVIQGLLEVRADKNNLDMRLSAGTYRLKVHLETLGCLYVNSLCDEVPIT